MASNRVAHIEMMQAQGLVVPYTAIVVTAKTGVKKWSRGQVMFSVSGQEVKDNFF